VKKEKQDKKDEKLKRQQNWSSGDRERHGELTAGAMGSNQAHKYNTNAHKRTHRNAYLSYQSRLHRRHGSHGPCSWCWTTSSPSSWTMTATTHSNIKERHIGA